MNDEARARTGGDKVQLALDVVPTAIAYVTADGTCEFLNAAMRELLRQPGGPRRQLPLELVFGPPAGSFIRTGIEMACRTGMPESITISLPRVEFPVTVRIAPDPGGADDLPRFYVTAATEQAHETESGDDLREMCDALAVAVILVDADFRLVRWNGAFEKLGIVAPSQLHRGRPIRDALIALTRAATVGGPRASDRAPFDPRGGSGRQARFRVSMPPAHRIMEGESTLLADGRIVIAFSDVTEAASARDELARSERLRTIGQLTGGIAHDFNNLLTVIVGNLDLLEDSPLFDDQPELVSAAKRAALRGSSLTGALLSYGRGMSTGHAVRTDVNDALRSLEKILTRTLGGAVRVQSDLAPDLPDVRVNPGMLESAIINLVLNGRDAMPGGGTIVLTTEHTADTTGPIHATAGPGGWVRISVRDTGDGMRPEVKVRALEPFFTTKPEGRGTGLGLSMVHRFVHEADGSMAIESAPGEGTTVHVHLPALGEASSSDPEPRTVTPSPVDAGHHVLLVEDDPLVRNTFRSMLLRLGYQVTDVDSGEVALEVLGGSARFDVLLADVRIAGGMGGPDLARRVSANWPAVRCVLISGHPDADRPFGIPLVAKPCHLNDLAQEVSKALDGG